METVMIRYMNENGQVVHTRRPGTRRTGFLNNLSFWTCKLLLLMFVLALSLQLSAQVDMGRLVGSITDPSGARLQGAKVVVKNLDTGVTRSTASGTGGLYLIPSLPAGRYLVSVESDGFQTGSQTANVAVGGTVERSFRLSVNGAIQQVSVSAQSGLELQTESHTVGGILGTAQLEQLPVSGRNPLSFASVEPGVSPGTDPSVSTSSAQFWVARSTKRPAIFKMALRTSPCSLKLQTSWHLPNRLVNSTSKRTGLMLVIVSQGS
jgi:hypothetical protein